MKQLFKFLSSYKKECIFAPLFKLFEATLELFVPLVMAAIIDHGIGSRDYGFIETGVVPSYSVLIVWRC